MALLGDWKKHLDLCLDRQRAEDANKACCLLPLYDLFHHWDIQVTFEKVKERNHDVLLLMSGTPTTCSASMATPWVCLHGWGATHDLSWKFESLLFSSSNLSLAFFQKWENSVQTLRYTLWIPLYPTGFICEGVIALRNIPYFEETDRSFLQLIQMPSFYFAVSDDI